LHTKKKNNNAQVIDLNPCDELNELTESVRAPILH